jgi:hypothetical protein
MTGDSIATRNRRQLAPSAARRNGTADVFADLRSVDRLSDAQLIAAELLIYTGLPEFRIAQRMNLEPAILRRWFRDPVFIAACNELTRAYAAGQLVPLGLYRLRAMMSDPFAKLRDVVHATRFAAELAGLYRTGAPEAGTFAPGPAAPLKPLAEMSREELHRLMIQGQQAQDRLLNDSADDFADPLS